MRSKVYIDTGRLKTKKEYDHMLIEHTFVQVYVNIIELFYQINRPSSLHLLMWVIISMDNYNQINLGKANRSEFIYDCIKNNGKAYSDRTTQGSIYDLVNLNILVSMNTNGERQAIYMVNPDYFWKTRIQADRLDAIKGFINQIKINEDE